MVDQPLVTIIVICFNHEAYLIECLNSVISQTYNNIQLIIADDKSSDNSVDKIDYWIKSNNVDCIFIKHETNIGLCKTLNQCLSFARGDFISIVATDDVWLPDKISIQIETFIKLPSDVGVLYTDAMLIDEKSNIISGRHIKDYGKLYPFQSRSIYGDLLNGNFIPALTAITRSSCYNVVGYYDESLIFEDLDMWLRISSHFKMFFMPVVTAKYRVVSDSLYRTMGDNGIETMLRIYIKCISWPINTRETRARLKLNIKYFAVLLYKHNYANCNKLIIESIKCTYSLKLILVLLLLSVGIKGSAFKS